MKRLLISILGFILFLSPVSAEEVIVLRTPSGITANMAFRALEPGEPILITIGPEHTVIGATVTFLGTTVRLAPETRTGRLLGVLGVDLALEPGRYPFEILVERRGMGREVIREQIEIEPRIFPSQKLTVSQEYVTPPGEVQERIRRESEIMGWVFGMNTEEWLGEGGFIAPHPAQAWPNFGQRRITNGTLNSIHTGVDVRVPFGEPIRSVNAGRVVLASSLYMPGKTVIIDHGLGIFSFYCHLSRVLVRRGSLVGKGNIIGRCGSTGRSTGPHLHWSMRIRESRVDPYAMLELPIDR